MDENYWLVRLKGWDVQELGGIRYDFLTETGYLGTGWARLSKFNTEEEILGHYESEHPDGNNKAVLERFLAIKDGDVLIVPWPNWKHFRLFKATSGWMNYDELLKHSRKANE